MSDLSGDGVLSRLRDDVDAELARARSSGDPVGDDEPELEPYLTRLGSLSDAVAVMEAYEQERDPHQSADLVQGPQEP